MTRRPLMAIVGSGADLDDAIDALAQALGRAAIEKGFRLVTGGRAGVMEAAARGAKSAPNARDGDVIGILPGDRHDDANPYVDIALPTGLGHGRNMLVVAAADVVVAVCGAAGTLSELAFAWLLERPVIALASAGGVAGALAALDSALHDAAVVTVAQTAGEAVEAAIAALKP